MAPTTRFVNDSVHWFMNELTSRVVAKSGIPSDRYHLGKIILQSFKDAPDFVLQIDGVTDESMTFKTAMEQSIKCATAFKNIGLVKGDVVVIMAPNIVNLQVPFYAALYLGMIVSPIDRTYGISMLSFGELEHTFKTNKPKIVFCLSDKATDVQLALNNLDLDCRIVTYDKGDYLCSFEYFLDKNGDNIDVDEFQPEEFDPEETIAVLIPTSGTTGLPKAAAATHKNFAISGGYLWSRFREFPTPTKIAFIASPLQWLTALLPSIISPIFRYTRLVASKNATPELTYYLLKKYKPTFTIMSPTMLTALLKDKNSCDFTSFEQILVGGSAVTEDLLQEIREMSPDSEVANVYGMTESASVSLDPDNSPPGSVGRPSGFLEYRLVDPDTRQDLTEPNTIGELWIRGPTVFKEYYNNSKATLEAFAEGRWFMTGDLFYRDSNWYFYFVDRLKLLLKYKSYQISPVELEAIIRQLPGVLDAAVVGLPDPECGDLVVACVVRKNGSTITAQDVKDFVRNNLSDAKQIRGGVVFMNEIPMTASTKIHRQKLKEMVKSMERE